MTTTKNPTDSPKPNLYELKGEDVQITYATTSIAGRPQLTVEHKGASQSFQGEQIRVQEIEIGTLVTVTLEQVPDLMTVTLTIVLPSVNLDETGETIVRLHAVRTTTRTSFGGPRLVKGQIQSYDVLPLEGAARAARF
jgi:hypothetical protein